MANEECAAVDRGPKCFRASDSRSELVRTEVCRLLTCG